MDKSDHTLDEEQIKVRKWPFMVLGGVVIVLWSAYWWLVVKWLIGWPTRGQFGDLFGGLNALFSGFAFAGLIYTIYLQHKELQLQRLELKQTRKELEGQKLQLEAQNKTMQKQDFNNAFFQLLRFHNDLLSSMDLILRERDKYTVSGRDCFKQFHMMFKSHYDANASSSTGLERVKTSYMAFFKNHQSDLGHYFRNLYNIIKFIENSSMEDKQMYTNLVRAQISSFEHALLFYNGLSDLGCEKFKPLIERDALLKNMPDDVLLDPSHKGFYNEQAFG
ncbi:MAG: putative phage abortive infection protein [Planctomycetota bacterium]|jgi:hypothetical protein